MNLTKKKTTALHQYEKYGHVLETVTESKYLGVTIQNNLEWGKHISKCTAKANSTLGFVRRNLYRCSEEVKLKAYTALVRPHTEYASAAWDQHHQTHKDQLQKV